MTDFSMELEQLAKMLEKADGHVAPPGRRETYRATSYVVEMRILVAEDGTDTVVTLEGKDGHGEWRKSAVGRARRRKGERRNGNLGRALAMARAFQQVADAEAEEAERYW